MKAEPEILYAALKARDSRFDGRFFVGVSSTGIYCRPVCPAKTPKPEHCEFFPSAAAAEAAGFRPCLRCRPECAPGCSSVDAASRLAHAAARMIEEGVLEEDGVRELAERLDVTARHLRRVFSAQFGVSPVKFAQTHRLLLARRLLTETPLPVTEVALASGFSSLRRFNALFRQRYQMAPSALRKATDATVREALSFRLAYRPPFDRERILAFLANRAIEGVETVENGCYRRSIRLFRRGKSFVGWVEIRQAEGLNALEVEFDVGLSSAIPQVLDRVRRLFDLGCQPDVVATVLGPLAAPRPGLRLPGAFDPFEVAVRAILGQRISVKAARTVAGRFAAAFGDGIGTPFSEIVRVFPSPERIARLAPDDVMPLGVVRKRAEAIVALARAMAEGTLSLEPDGDVEKTIALLQALPGVGPWTAQYVAMRGMSWPDAFPYSDLGVRKALRESKPARLIALAERWRPWRSYAVMHLWSGGEDVS